MVHRVMPEKTSELLPIVEEERMFDEEGIECFEIESVSDRRRLPTSRAMEYLVKWKGYEKLHDTWITKKEAVTSGALKLSTDFDGTVTSGINLPDANRTSQITQDLPIGVTAAQIAGPGQTDPRVRKVRSVVP